MDVTRKLVYLVACSLDGKIARDDGSFDAFIQEGDHVAEYIEMLKSFDDVLMGRNTYEVGTRAGVTNPYPGMRGHVFSRSMAASPDKNVTLVSDNAAAYVLGLKQQPGRDIYLCGGSKLAGTLLDAHLIDEIIVKLNPLVIGPGIPLFDGIGMSRHLELIRTRNYASGVVLLSYRVSKKH